MECSKRFKRLYFITGILFTLIVGTLLHYTYDWSNHNTFISFIAPISESVWEHFKLGFYALLFYVLLTYPWAKKCFNNFLFATGLATLGMNLFIGLGYYLYNTFTHESFYIDIALFIVGVLLAFFILYKLLTLGPLPLWTTWLGLILLLGTISLFIVVTLNPPTQYDLFKNPID